MSAISTPLAVSNCGVRPPYANALLITANPARTRTRASPTWVSARIAPLAMPSAQLGWLSEVVGHEHGLAVSRHQRMDRAEQHGGSHRSEYGPSVATCDLTEAAGHAAIEPVLDRD